MKELCFRKIKESLHGSALLIFEQGEWQKPIIILEKPDVKRLMVEWNKEK